MDGSDTSVSKNSACPNFANSVLSAIRLNGLDGMGVDGGSILRISFHSSSLNPSSPVKALQPDNDRASIPAAAPSDARGRGPRIDGGASLRSLPEKWAG